MSNTSCLEYFRIIKRIPIKHFTDGDSLRRPFIIKPQRKFVSGVGFTNYNPQNGGLFHAPFPSEQNFTTISHLSVLFFVGRGRGCWMILQVYYHNTFPLPPSPLGITTLTLKKILSYTCKQNFFLGECDKGEAVDYNFQKIQ